MWSLLKAALLLAALAAFLFLLPFGGRTLADRWRAAGGASSFAARTWAEMRGAPIPKAQRRPGVKPPAHAAAPGEQAPPGAAPAEAHSEDDRRELDKLLGDHLADAPKR